MLEHLGFVVDLVPAVAEFLHQVRLNEAVPANHRKSEAHAFGGQTDGAVGLMVNEALVLELSHHFRHRGIGDPEPQGKL
ncbi:hypothetical protein PJL18_04056 [Paenarthrobacter nicotinovorans]|nr:hypothetical protein [Paenarthrobacter nicotinovorans]